MLRSGLIATKIGNSSFYHDNGTNTQVTVLKIDECVVTSVKTMNKCCIATVTLESLKAYMQFSMLDQDFKIF